MLYVKEPEAKILKHDIRKALIYAMTSNLRNFPLDVKVSIARNIISDFYHSLNRKKILDNEETETELKKAYLLLSQDNAF